MTRWRWTMAVLLAVLAGSPCAALATEGPGSGPTPSVDTPRQGPGVAVIPFMFFSSDVGLGGGAVASAYWFGGVRPYRIRVDLMAMATTRFMQLYYLGFDVPRLPFTTLRLSGVIGFTNTVDNNYCGLGMASRCRDLPVAPLSAGGLLERPTVSRSPPFLDAREGDPRVRYNQYRQANPFVGLAWRAPLWGPVHLHLGYDLNYFIIRPYAGSQLEAERPLGAARGGASSVPEVGVVVDTRDHEGAPTRGVFSEVSVRASNSLLGGGYAWAGANATVRVFAPLHDGGTVVAATRVVADAVVGDQPFYEQSFFGGTDRIFGFGGERAGRGLRFQRYIGKGKFMFTEELRVRLAHLALHLPWLGRQDVEGGTVGFIDVAKIIGEWPGLRGGRWHWDESAPWWALAYGVGGGLRLVVNRAMVLRADLAVSPQDAREPRVYMNIGHVF